MKLTKNNLIKKLGVTNEETISLITEYKDKLPILTDDNEGHCINTRYLHEQLGVGRDYSTWIKARIKKYDLVENEDYTIENLIHQNGGIKKQGGDRKSTNYIVTLEVAKQLAMVENNENGKLARRYFITVEKILKEAIKWEKIRKPEKERYREMCSELKLYFLRNFNKEPKNFDYMNEANALNVICLGAKAQEIREYIEAQDSNTRDWLDAKYNLYLDKMQELNIMYLKMNMDKERRYDLIKQGFKALYPDACFMIATKKIS